MAENFGSAGHLPNLRSDRQPSSPERLPRQRNGVTPQMHGRYPDYNVLDEVDHWDEVTRRVVLERIENVPPIRFFTHDEQVTLSQFCDIVMAQDREPRIPVLNFVDEKMWKGELDGFRFAGMPDDRETWRRSAVGLDAVARQHGAADFATAPTDVQHKIVDAFHQGELQGEIWDEIDPSTAFSVLMRAILSAFYSHPWAWNEMGFGGPAYPRGYARMAAGEHEAWESSPLPQAETDPVVDSQERGVEGA